MEKIFAYKNADEGFQQKLRKAVPKLHRHSKKQRRQVKVEVQKNAEGETEPKVENIKQENIKTNMNNKEMNCQQAISALKGNDTGMRSASRQNHDLYIQLHNTWVANTGNSITFEDWMAQAHDMYNNKPNRAISFDKWLAVVVEQKVMNAQGGTQAAPSQNAAQKGAQQKLNADAAAPKRVLGMTPNVAIPVFFVAGLIITFAFVKFFVLKNIQK